MFFFIWIYIFFKSNEKKIRLIFKTIGITLSSLIIVNPILIIPPLSIGGNQIPNFYKIYLNWLTTQGSNSDDVQFDISYSMNWIEFIPLNDFVLIDFVKFKCIMNCIYSRFGIRVFDN